MIKFAFGRHCADMADLAPALSCIILLQEGKEAERKEGERESQAGGEAQNKTQYRIWRPRAVFYGESGFESYPGLP